MKRSLKAKLTDSNKLKSLAEWFDIRDECTLYLSENIDSNSDEVQKDLRRIAKKLDHLEAERDRLKEMNKKLIDVSNDDVMTTEILVDEIQKQDQELKALKKAVGKLPDYSNIKYTQTDKEYINDSVRAINKLKAPIK